MVTSQWVQCLPKWQASEEEDEAGMQFSSNLPPPRPLLHAPAMQSIEID